MTEYEIYPSWNKLREQIYKRDEAVCWVCGEFVNLNEYELGHLIDKCNGGQIEEANLAVMHQSCNMQKPRHETLQEAYEWRDNARKTNIIDTIKDKHYRNQHKRQHTQDSQAAQELTLEYFRKHPSLLIGTVNHNRSKAMRELASLLDVNIIEIRQWLVDARFVKPKIIRMDNSQYYKVSNNLQSLYDNYKRASCKSSILLAKALGLTRYEVEIMFFLFGMPNKMMPKNLHAISKKVAKLKLPILNTTLSY